MQKGRRTHRVNALLQKELADILRKDVSDPRVQWVTIVNVEVTPDLSKASVYVSSLKREPSTFGETITALQRAAGFIRRELGRRVEMRSLPQLCFFPSEEHPFPNPSGLAPHAELDT